MHSPIQDFAAGPLDKYRQLASFDWKKLRIFIFGQDFIDVLETVGDKLKKHAAEIFPSSTNTSFLSEVKRTATKRMFLTYKMGLFQAGSESLNSVIDYLIYTMEPAFTIKGGLVFGLFPSTILYLGTDRHTDIYKKALSGEIIGCFALTEVGHGSNTKALKTTATYDVNTKEFIIHSPDFEAAKCWIGVLGYTATYATVMAHLTTPDGVKRGLHAFLVPVRDPLTLLPYRGLTITEMGEKIGLNGIDNGLIMFNNYRIPKENLLNRISDVSEDGTYHSSYTDSNKQHGAIFGNLSSGRISIVKCNVYFLGKALTIAIRYSAVRKQFGIGNGEEEISILEYQTHQYRLLPYLAANYCMIALSDFLHKHRTPRKEEGNLSDISAELHALSSAAKPLVTWTTRNAIQECREACGGHGYLKASGIGDLRNDQDASCTYEGANHVLLQQTSKWLLKFWPLVVTGKKFNTPFASIAFLNNAQALANAKFSYKSTDSVKQPQMIISTYQWLVYSLLKRYSEKYLFNLEKNSTPISAHNNSQVFVANNLAIAYIEHVALEKMLQRLNQSNDPNIKAVLTKLFSLYGLWSLHKHMPALYIGGYAIGPEPSILIQDAILELCGELKNDAVTLVDVIAPPDYVLNSVLGYADGQVYKHLETALLHTPEAIARPDWWKEIVNWNDYVKARL